MGIWKIDGIKIDSKGRKNEGEFNINLLIRKGQWQGVQLDVEITPFSVCDVINNWMDSLNMMAHVTDMLVR